MKCIAVVHTSYLIVQLNRFNKCNYWINKLINRVDKTLKEFLLIKFIGSIVSNNCLQLFVNTYITIKCNRSNFESISIRQFIELL